ncbi:hypothetical protein N2152v2_004334 [Parachlorella kessleri]
MATLATLRLAPQPLQGRSNSSRRTGCSRLVVCSKKKHHKAAGRGPEPVAANQDQQRQVIQDRLAAQKQPAKTDAPSEPRPKSLQSMEADEEFKHMPQVQKWFLEAKAALYAWLGTGVEPL